MLGDLVVNIQVQLSEKADEIVAIYKIKNKLKTKAQAINQMIEKRVV